MFIYKFVHILYVRGNCRKTLMITVQILMLMLVALTKDDDDADNVGQCWSIIIIKSN